MQVFTEVRGRRQIRLRYLVPLVALVLVSPTLTLLEAERVAWPWFLVGAVASSLVLGPFARTATGQAVDDWFTRIGVAGRVVVIVAFAIVVWTAKGYLQPDPVNVSSFVVGSVLAITVVAFAERLRARPAPE